MLSLTAGLVMKLYPKLFTHMCVCAIFAHRHINNNNFEGNIDAIKDLTNLEKLCVCWAKGIIEKQSIKLLLIYSISQKSAQLLVILFLNLLNDEKNSGTWSPIDSMEISGRLKNSPN